MSWYEWLIWIFIAIGILIILAYVFVLPFGAPYLPTMKKQRQQALDLIGLKKGETLYDLGCGDGAMLVAAAKRGLTVVGYEINPFLVIISWLRTRRYGRQVKIRFRSFWKVDLSGADGVFIFLITHKMKQFDKFVEASKGNGPLKVVSNAFEIPGKKPLKKSGAMLLYIYK